MSVRFKPYPRYKDSGAEWLGEIPEKWNVKRLKFCASVRFSSVDKHTLAGEEPVRLCNYTDVYYNDRITADSEFMSATASREEIERFSIEPDDVLITKDSETWDDIAVAAHVPRKIDNLLCGYHLALVRPNKRLMDGEYLARAFSARGINDQFRVAATGITRFGVGNSDIGDALFLLPSRDEQRAIAEFLDRETAKIDNLIAKKERLLELLEEKRAALITHAVTCGLDPDAPLRDSGIEWLGQIPKHWEVRRLRFISRIETGSKNTEDATNDGKYPFFVRAQTVEHISSYAFDCEAVLTAGDGVGVGKVFHHYTGKFDVHQRVYALTDFRDVLGRFLFLYMRELFYRVALGGDAKSTVDSLRRHNFTDLAIAFPSAIEQQAIVDYCDGISDRVSGLATAVSTAISHLKEYRGALITAAVTGKIDVREKTK